MAVSVPKIGKEGKKINGKEKKREILREISAKYHLYYFQV